MLHLITRPISDEVTGVIKPATSGGAAVDGRVIPTRRAEDANA